MSVVDIPVSGDSLTREWISLVMQDVLGAPVGALRSVTVSRIGLGIGIMGESFQVRMDWAPEAQGLPDSVVIKLASQAPENRKHGVNLGLYDAETRFYRDLASSTRARTPGCFFVSKDADGADFVIVMEDLTGLRMVDQASGLTTGEATAAVLALADLHASWWGVEARGSGDSTRAGPGADIRWAPSLVHPRIEAMAGMWLDLWPTFAARFSDSLSEESLRVGEVVSRRYWEGMQKLAEAPWTLLHMDFRCENLLFDDSREGADAVVVLDWQSLGRGAAAYDLAYLLGGSLEVESRRRTERDLVDLYIQRLVARGVNGYGPDRLWHDYRLAHLLAGTATCVLTGGTMDLGNARGRELIATMTARHFTAAADLDALQLLH